MDIYVLLEGVIEKRKETKKELEITLNTIKAILAKTEKRSVFYDELLERKNFLEKELEKYPAWYCLTKKEFSEWYYEESKKMYEQMKLLKGKVVCKKCNKTIDDPRNMRFFSDRVYDPECYFEIAMKELKGKDDLGQEFILRTLQL
ncbi:MAG: hypothetical protein QXW65_02630 [Candidatus Pacearchaeota archaeon]